MLSVTSQPNQVGLSPSEMQAVTSFYDGLQQILKFREGLNQRESSRLMRLSRENLLFVDDSIAAIKQLPEVCPRFLDPTIVNEESEFYSQLRYLEQLHLQAGAALKDMRLRLGDKCFRNGLLIYNSVQSAAKNGYPKVRPIYKQMRMRFPSTLPLAEDRDSQEEPTTTNEGVTDSPESATPSSSSTSS